MPQIQLRPQLKVLICDTRHRHNFYGDGTTELNPVYSPTFIWGHANSKAIAPLKKRQVRQSFILYEQYV